MRTGDGDRSRLRADRLLEAGHPRDAERLIRDAMGSEPDSPELLAMLSEALLGQGRATPAAEAARLGLRQDPQDLRLRLDLAQALIRAGRSDDAREIADTLVADAPWLWAAHYTLAQAWLGQPLPRARLALASAERARELAPDSPDPLVLIAIAQGRLGDAKAQRAAHQQALALDPSHAHALSNLAATDLTRGRLHRAGRGMSSALASSPQESAPQRNLELLLAQMTTRLFWAALFCLTFVCILFFEPWLLHATVAVLMIAGLALVVRCFARVLPRGMSTSGELWHRAQRITRVRLLLTSGLVVGLLGVGLAPTVHLRTDRRGPGLDPSLLPPVAMTYVLAVLAIVWVAGFAPRILRWKGLGHRP